MRGAGDRGVVEVAFTQESACMRAEGIDSPQTVHGVKEGDRLIAYIDPDSLPRGQAAQWSQPDPAN
jgi:hypothetical protein